MKNARRAFFPLDEKLKLRDNFLRRSVVDWYHATEHLALAAHLAFGEGTQQAQLQYLDLRSEGWLIDSGMVESAGKRFKDRFTRAGMRWSRTGAEHLLPVRTAIMSSNFDAHRLSAYNSPPN